VNSLPTTTRHAFERYEQPLLRYAMRFVRDHERARDVVQDTFLRMCESDVDAEDPRLGAWLYTVCRNRAIDVQRREGRVTVTDTPPELEVDPSGEHERAVCEVFDRARSLPERKARVLSLRYREGRSYRQIADETGMSVSHVGVVLHDCIKYLRKHMAVGAGLLLLVGAGWWGVQSSRTPAPAPSYLDPEPPRVPMVERGELSPVSDDVYGPEEYYGPEERPDANRRGRGLEAPHRFPSRSLRRYAPAPKAKPRAQPPAAKTPPADATSL
jgi:RNA polymerase sigma-70 factor (ECF subfamily)